MNIWLINSGEPLPLNESIKKMRTALVADKLVQSGNQVLWWTSAFDHMKKSWTVEKEKEIIISSNYKIFAIKGIGYRKNISISRYIDNRIVAKKFRMLATSMPIPDIMVAATPPYDFAYEAIMFAKRYKVPIIIDIRDEWPELFLRYCPKPLKSFFRFLLFYDFKMIENVMSQANSLISMMNGLLDWGLKYSGRARASNDKVFYLGSNRTEHNDFNSILEERLSYKKRGEKFIVTYIGTFATNNDPSMIIDAASRLSDRNISFILAGDGDLFEETKKKAKGVHNVSFLGWLNDKDVLTLLMKSHLGIIPTRYYREAFPNKFFIYLSAGLPVISSFVGELKKLIEEKMIGLYYEHDNLAMFVDSILTLYNDIELYRKMSWNAIRVFDELFDADNIYQEYANHIEKVAKAYYEPHRDKT